MLLFTGLSATFKQTQRALNSFSETNSQINREEDVEAVTSGHIWIQVKHGGGVDVLQVRLPVVFVLGADYDN